MTSASIIVLAVIITCSVTLRWLIGGPYNSYSGKNTPPMYGDYEAQRHWMEITLHFHNDTSKWYSYDVLYWGLDYPPLSAYLAYFLACITPYGEMVAFETSRGFESIESLIFMRLSVIVLEVLILFPALIAYGGGTSYSRIMTLLSFPTLLLVDHGHFQYNAVALGLVVWTLYFLKRRANIVASILFCLALSFKHISLYYAPAIAAVLLNRTIFSQSYILFLKLALTVVCTFSLVLAPMLLLNTEVTSLELITMILHRLFPFNRGLFEDKVANAWCMIDFVFKLKKRVSQPVLVKACFVSTVIGFAPSVVNAMMKKDNGSSTRTVLTFFNTSMAFFLFSYQVHEKSILFPMIVLNLLLQEEGTSFEVLVPWMSSVSAFSIFPLLRTDGVVVQYVAYMVLYNTAFVIYPMITRYYNKILKAVVTLSLLGMVAVHLLELLVKPPVKYPHVFLYIYAAYSFLHFFLLFTYTNWYQLVGLDAASTIRTKQKAE